MKIPFSLVDGRLFLRQANSKNLSAVTLRIEEVILAEKLEILTESAADHPVYHGKLKKVPLQAISPMR
jgi:hypothetical protein